MFNFSTHTIFIIGFISGTLISFFIQIINNSSQYKPYIKAEEFPYKYENWFRNQQYSRKYVAFDLVRYSDTKYLLESELLFKSISVFCLVLVTKDNNLKAIKNTWGKGCNDIDSIKFSKKSKIFPLKQSHGDNSWIKFCQVLKNVPRKYEWILVVNDDTFAIMENLRYYVAYRNTSEYLYFGYPVKFWNTVYNLGKAGYVLSKGVLDAIRKSDCHTRISFRNREDFILGNHLASLNISVMDSKYEEGLSLFYPYNLNRLLFPSESKSNFEPVYKMRCCSKYIITFNAMDAEKMYKYYYMLYTLQLFHHGNLGNRQPAKLPDEEVWQNFLREQNLPLNISNEKYYEAWENLIDSPDSFGRNMKREDYSDSLD